MGGQGLTYSFVMYMRYRKTILWMQRHTLLEPLKPYLINIYQKQGVPSYADLVSPHEKGVFTKLIPRQWNPAPVAQVSPPMFPSFKIKKS